MTITFSDLKLVNGEDMFSCDKIRKANDRICLSDALQQICQFERRQRATDKIIQIRNRHEELEDHLQIRKFYKGDSMF